MPVVKAPVEQNEITSSEHLGQYVHLHAQLAQTVEHVRRIPNCIKVVDAGVSVIDHHAGKIFVRFKRIFIPHLTRALVQHIALCVA